MLSGFLLTRQWRAEAEGMLLNLWFSTPEGACQVEISGQESVLFVAAEQQAQVERCLGRLRGWRQQAVALKNFHNRPLNAVYCRHYHLARDIQQRLAQSGIDCWEADIRPPERFLMERFITASVELAIEVECFSPTNCYRDLPMRPANYRPSLRSLSLDIETSMDAEQLYSIAVAGESEARVFMIGDYGVAGVDRLMRQQDDFTIVYCADARDCLLAFLDWLADYDPDVIIGWNLVQFDLRVLQNLCERHRLEFGLGRNRQSPVWRQENAGERHFITIPGRVALDGIELLKAASYQFVSYSLESVSRVLLDQGKLLQGSQRGEDITALFHSNKVALAQYNLQDCRLVNEIFERKKLLQFAVERSQLTGLLMDRIGGSVAAFEFAYLPQLHRKGYVAPNLGELESDLVSPGGYVMESKPGLYEHVLVLDFKSLYPSIIRTFAIDPCAFWLAQHQIVSGSENENDRVAGFNGAEFVKDEAILPGLIDRLWAARDRAKAEDNQPLSQAIKIIMNSFYGVLGSTGCRFYDPRVSSSITLRGHEILQRSRDWIHQQGFEVIYGDTDSVFVWLERDLDADEASAIGEQLAAGLNEWWGQTLENEHKIESHLEIEFETHYATFFMPTLRGAERGSKKRYAGLVGGREHRHLVFKGLENARTDWTELAKEFQAQLYLKIFNGEAYRAYVRQFVEQLLSGERDGQLIYRKRLRREIDAYQKNRPPHVQAAEKLRRTGVELGRGDWVSYLLTLKGPEELRHRSSAIDYQSYIDRQLMPVADSILQFVDDDFSSIINRQIGLFDN